MPSGDSNNTNRPGRQSGPARPKTVSPNPEHVDPKSGNGEELPRQVDFGTYVSSTVRSSAELFGTPARSAPSRNRSSHSRSSAPPPQQTYDDFGAGEHDDEPVAATPTRSSAGARKPSRYWRDAAGGGASDPNDQEDDGGDDRGPGQFALPWSGDGRSGMVLGGIALAVLATIALFWLLNRDGGGSDDPTPTPTQESVIDAPSSPISTPSNFVPEQEVTPEPTEAPRRGGDNQRNQDSDGTPGAIADDPLAGIELGPVASECPERCLVRVAETNHLDDLMLAAGTRPSYSGDGWRWVIATPEGIAYLEQQTETTMVSEQSDTIALYVARLPDDGSGSDVVPQLGDVLDSVDNYRVVESPSVPANVKPLTDWGIEVSKMAPAPPLELVQHEEATELSSIEIGALLDEVSSNNIESTILDLQGMGSADDSGIGSRYYTRIGNSMAAEYLFNRLESYGLTVWYEDFITWDGYLAVNVIGEIPGSDTSAIYGVMAHFDTISDDFAVSPGADDNATGISASLEIARILGEYELHHPLRVVFVNVEEVGIVGSEQFAENARENNIPYEGIYNLDSVGAERQHAYLVVNGSDATAWMSDLYVRINDAYGLGQVINVQENDAIVADDNRLRDNGIDSLMVARELYGQSPYHHTSKDRIDTLSIPSVVSCSQLTLLTLAELVRA